VYERLYNYIGKMNIFNPNQFGFRACRPISISMALLDLQDKISQAIDERQHSIGICLDLAKAFDTVNHPILIKKLELIGFRGLPLFGFKSYLENRRQQIFCNGSLSLLKSLQYGVPQGSVFGPLLFLL